MSVSTWHGYTARPACFFLSRLVPLSSGERLRDVERDLLPFARLGRLEVSDHFESFWAPGATQGLDLGSELGAQRTALPGADGCGERCNKQLGEVTRLSWSLQERSATPIA